MKTRKNLKKAAALISIVSIVLIATLAVLSIGIFEDTIVESKPIDTGPDYPTDHLTIDASFLLKTGETNESVNVSCDLFMTNIWEKESGEIKATAYVSDQNSNFAVFKNTVEFGVIDANSTKELNIPVKFSDSSYKVEILIFESNKLVKKITLSITSYQNFYYSEKGEMVINIGRTEDDAARDGQWSVRSESPQIENIH